MKKQWAAALSLVLALLAGGCSNIEEGSVSGSSADSVSTAATEPLSSSPGGDQEDSALQEIEESGKAEAGSIETDTPSTGLVPAGSQVPSTSLVPAGGEPEPQGPTGDWESNPYLRLVNQTHPLPEDYEVETVAVYTGSNGKVYEMEKTAGEHMIAMISAAQKDGVNIGVTSAFRTLAYQTMLFNRDVEKYKAQGMTEEQAHAKTAQNVAIPGQSEHCAGLAADLLSSEHWSLDEGFENTAAFRWLDAHAAEYGYILRYPKGKEDITLITYEPWHYRYVGVEYAKKIKESGLCLEEYLS